MADSPLMNVIRAIAAGDAAATSRLLDAAPALARARVETGASREEAKEYFLDEIQHHVYAGDSALHLAAAAFRLEVVKTLLALGADVSGKNRRGAEPLHYAVDGVPGSSAWNPPAQAAVVACLIDAGADPNAPDAGGVTPLHRAVRNRCAAAVAALLEGGADSRRPNKNGSTPIRLAVQTTGRGGSGSPEAKEQQAEIIRLLERART